MFDMTEDHCYRPAGLRFTQQKIINHKAILYIYIRVKRYLNNSKWRYIKPNCIPIKLILKKMTKLSCFKMLTKDPNLHIENIG